MASPSPSWDDHYATASAQAGHFTTAQAQAAVFSHETAPALHELSDALPAITEMTVPRAWRKRRLRIPVGLELHFDDIVEPDRTWHGPVPITTPARTVRDFALAGVSRELSDQALAAGRQRGGLTDEDIAQTRRLLERRP